METLQLLLKAKGLGIKFSVRDSQLVVEAPKGAITEDMRNAIRENKPEIIKWTSANDAKKELSECASIGKLTNAYVAQRILELGLTKEDVRGETDPSLALDEEELNDIRNDERLFDIWVKHVHCHKQLKALELANKKQAEEYDLGDTLGSLPFEHKFKLIEYVLTTFKKFLFGERYQGEVPNKLFVEMWFLANHDLTIGQIFEASAEFVRLAKKGKDRSDDTEAKRLRLIAEDVEDFRKFCLVNNEAV